MSLLEDVFLEDEANEAQELERVIDGDEFDERPRSRSDSDDNSEREGEAEEEKKRVDPASTKARRVIKNPRFILNPARLTGPRGIQVIPEHFKDFKFKGKGHEKEDLDLVLKKLEHWAYRLYPKFQFEDCLKKIETLGKKRPVMVHLHKIRTDQFMSEETVVQRDSSDDEAPNEALIEALIEAPPEDEFDKLLQQQIELARSTPAPASVKKGTDSAVKENRSLMVPKATSSPSISEEQREKILKNRKLAEERRLARLKNASLNISKTPENIANNPSKSDNTSYTQNKMSDSEFNETSNANTETNDVRNFDNIVNTPSKRDNNCHIITNTHEEALSDNEIVSTNNVLNSEENHVGKVRNVRRNVIDSSDEDDIVVMNESIRADVHKGDDYINHIDDRKEEPKQTNEHKIDDDAILEIDENSINDQESDSSSDEDNIVLMNESIKADVHKADNEKDHTKYGKEQEPKLTDGNKNDDEILLENYGNSQVNDNLDIGEGTDSMISDKRHTQHVKEKQATKKVDGLQNIEGVKNLEIDNNYIEFDNFDDSNAKIDEENDLPMIITENNTNCLETPHIDVDMASNEKFATVSNNQKIEHNAEEKQTQETIFNEKEVPVVKESDKAVENNVDDLMDVEFDDDF